MKAADRLGTGSSFGKVPRGRSDRGRAKAVAQGDVPAYELVRLHLDEVAPTPLNPRRNFGSAEEKSRFGEELRQAQLAACVAVSRDAYLALWPDHESQIGAVAHVLVNGERRYRSAVHVGLEALDFVVRDDLASSREEFVNHLLKENLDREDFDVIERARGVQELVQVCSEQSSRGARTRAAERLGKDRSWITNQLALLELPHEVQAMLSSGDIAERDGRTLARHLKDHPGLEAADLIAHLKALKEGEVQAKAEEKAILQAARTARPANGEAPLLSADNNGAAAPPQQAEQPAAQGLLSADNKASSPLPSVKHETDVPESDESLLSADNKSRPSKTAGTVAKDDNAHLGKAAGKVADSPGVALPHQASQELVDTLPWTDPAWVDRQVRRRMDREDLKKLVWLLQAEEDE
ncbi:ParB/RepB/Spo0J family partition protein [Streptomyces sp. NPDC047525]|uniref:ParB/RepB/Spo0J family partition protein n=1 Tax=Streptomyces sp. NPDC047525 TaxID=3155264 RepID=UPI0033DD5579